MAIVDTGLVCRYYIDEAASGTTPTTVEDASANNYDLTTINYGSGNLAYTEVSGNRGLESTATTGTQRAVRAIDNTSDALRDAMQGVQKATLEVVVRLDSISASGGRVFGINNRVGSNGKLIFKGTATNNMFFSFNDVDSNFFDPGLAGARGVIQLVLDSTQATQADRVRMSVNGGTLTSISNSVALNETLNIGSDADLIAFNRENSGSFDRSFDGVLFYAALYAHAFSQQDCTDNYDVLTADDDTPAGSGTVHDITATDKIFLQDNLPREVSITAADSMLLEDPSLFRDSSLTSLDSLFLLDTPVKELSKVITDYLLLLDSATADYVAGGQILHDVSVTDHLLIQDYPIKSLDKVVLDAVFLLDVSYKLREHIERSKLLLTSLDNRTQELTHLSSVLLGETLSRSLEKVIQDTVLLLDQVISSFGTIHDITASDYVLLLSSHLKVQEAVFEDPVLVSDFVAKLLQLIQSDGLLFSDTVSTQTISAVAAALVYARLRAIPVLGTETSAVDNPLGMSINAIGASDQT